MKERFYNDNYLGYVSKISPKTNEKRSLFHAFWVGGTICVIGQLIRFALEFVFGLYGDELAGTTSAGDTFNSLAMIPFTNFPQVCP